MKKNTAYKHYILKTLKAVYSGFTGISFMLSFVLPTDITAQVVLLLISAVLYVVPFIVNVETIKHYEINGIKAFIVEDLLLVMLPAVVLAVVTEMIYNGVSTREVVLAGMGSFIFIGIALFTMLAFWIAYLVFNITYKKDE